VKILITGAAGFAGSSIAGFLLERRDGLEIAGIDNLARPGSEINRLRLQRLGVRFFHGDLRSASDFAALPAADWVIDAAANPSVLAGRRDGFGSRQLFENNLAALGNVLEYAKAHRAGLVLLSSSRVYSIPALASLPLKVRDDAYALDDAAPLPTGVSARGVAEEFSTSPPVSLYGSMKLASECVALEYGEAFDFPVWIDRCGVLAGAGQFGTAEQGIFSYWIHAHRQRRPLRYIGFEGLGQQVRDALHPHDLAALIDRQMQSSRKGGPRLFTMGGGPSNSMSLAALSGWCDRRFGGHKPNAGPSSRPYDVPWLIMDSGRAGGEFDWRPQVPLQAILEEIASHAERHPDWLERSGA